MPGHGSQDRVVGSAREADGELLTAQTNGGLSLDEESMDLSGVTVFKAPQLSGQ